MNTLQADSPRESPGGETHSSRTLRQLRESLGLTQAELARLVGFSTRWVAAQEAAGTTTRSAADRRVTELERFHDALCRVVQPSAVKGWFIRPNAAFEGLKPLEVVERGQIDRLWQMIFFLESGVVS